MIEDIIHEEYVSRQINAQKLMAERDLQALLITDATNLFYFSETSYFGEMSYPRPAALLIPQSCPAMLLTHDFHLAVPWKGEVREYSKVGELPIDILQNMFADAGCSDGKIGMELGREQRLGISYLDFLKVQNALPQASFIDAADLIWTLRMQNSDKEISIIQEACRIHDAISNKCFSGVETGMTTQDIEQLFRVTLAESEAGTWKNT